MSGGDETPATIRFGVFEVDTRSGELRKRGVKLKLADQAYRVLRELTERPGEVVTRDALKAALWPDRSFVDSASGINKSVSQLRTVLGDNGPSPRFIETVARRGYRFIAPVAPRITPEPPATVVAVLPFENLTGDPGQAFIADGIAEE
jgi:cholera toxin transcriptional activator